MDYTVNKGKCCDCNTNKPLDEMVRKDGVKGLYCCTDCNVENMTGLENFLSNDFIPTSEIEIKKVTKKAKVLRWCLG